MKHILYAVGIFILLLLIGGGIFLVVQKPETIMEAPSVTSTVQPGTGEGNVTEPQSVNTPMPQIFSGELNPYKSTQSIQKDWGDQPEQFGLQQGEDVESVGPQTFVLDQDGNLHVIDTIHGQIKVINPEGILQSDHARSVEGSNIVVGSDGTLFSLEGEQLSAISQTGERASFPLSTSIPAHEGYGEGMRFDDAGNLYLCKLQACYLVGKNQNGQVVVVQPEEQNHVVKAGYPISESRTIRTNWQNNGRDVAVEILNAQNEIVQVIPLKSSDPFGSVLFLQQDVQGMFYFEVERLLSDNTVHLEVWKFDATGQIVSITELPNDYSSTVYKKIEVDKQGTIHQMLTTPEGIQFLTWESE